MIICQRGEVSRLREKTLSIQRFLGYHGAWLVADSARSTYFSLPFAVVGGTLMSLEQRVRL